MVAESNATLARHFFAEQDRLRGGPAPQLCGQAYTAHLAGQTLDLAGHEQFAAAFYAGFPDIRHQVELVAAEGDRAAVRFTLHGTHTGAFLGIPPTGRPILVAASAIMQIANAQVVTLWAEFDQLGLMRQLTGPVEERVEERGI